MKFFKPIKTCPNPHNAYKEKSRTFCQFGDRDSAIQKRILNAFLLILTNNLVLSLISRLVDSASSYKMHVGEDGPSQVE